MSVALFLHIKNIKKPMIRAFSTLIKQTAQNLQILFANQIHYQFDKRQTPCRKPPKTDLMKHRSPASFPRKIKRFQSYSMTPMDLQFETQLSFQNMSLDGVNKFTNPASNRQSAQMFESSNANSSANQFCPKSNSKLFSTNSLSFKNSEKTYIQCINKQKIHSEADFYATRQQNNRKTSTSEIFSLSSIDEKKLQTTKRATRKSTFLGNQAELKGTEHFTPKEFGQKNERRQREIRIPSFLQNKNKKNKNQQNFQFSSCPNLETYENSLNNQNLRFEVQKKRSFKKQKFIDSSKSLETQGQRSLFSPPSSSKLSFSKATASTICTNLPRQQSRRTFKDFEDLQSLKQMQNSMEDSEEANSLESQFENLFGKEQTSTKHLHLFESEIAQLFSDEQDEGSEQFNEDLKDELEQLF